MTVVVGIDLAWSPRNRTGIAVAVPCEDGYVVESATIARDDDEIVDQIARATGQRAALVAVDAPLRVPNEVGRRRCERELSADYAARHAGTHSSNRTLFARYGGVRGERLAARLAGFGFVVGDGSRLEKDSRCVVEVYPHPALVNLLNLSLALKYKRKPGRSAAVRAEAWGILKAGLRRFARATPALSGLDALLQEDDAETTGLASKSYEDRIDAVVCAYIGVHALHWGTRGCRIYGSTEEGSILVPVHPATSICKP